MALSPRQKVLVFWALFFGAAGFLFMVLSCGTEYWLLAAETCGSEEEGAGGRGVEERSNNKVLDRARVFHEGLFWRCFFKAPSEHFSLLNVWMSNQQSTKLCQAAFLFPFPVCEAWGAESLGLPAGPDEHGSAIVFRTFWSIFLVVGLISVIIGGFIIICAAPLTNPRLYKVGGAFQLCGGLSLLAVVLMLLLWIEVLDTLEQFVLYQSVKVCPSFHLSVHFGPSFLLAPVAVFCSLLAGLLSLLIGRSIQEVHGEKGEEVQEAPTSDV